jgi:carbon monoxide dehydrogenase subunit G
MNMTGERLILASQDKVWAALNDAEILKACIPGCESLVADSATEMKAVAAVKLGPISAKFTGDVTLSDLDPPNGYTISGEGRGGVAGFAKGGAKVSLAGQDGGTMLSYTVNAQVGGKIAQLGARLIDTTAKSMSEQFFTKFAARLETVAATQPKLDSDNGTRNDTTPSTSMPIPQKSRTNKDRSGSRIGSGIVIVVILIAVVVGIWRLLS